jgi:hypothetical protein
MRRTESRLKKLEARAGLQEPPDNFILYRDEEDLRAQLDTLPPGTVPAVVLPRVAESVEQWEAECKADAERRKPLEELRAMPHRDDTQPHHSINY